MRVNTHCSVIRLCILLENVVGPNTTPQNRLVR